MSLQFTKFASLPAEAGCAICKRIVLPLAFYCLTITWQQISEDALQVTVVGVLPHVTIERRLLGR